MFLKSSLQKSTPLNYFSCMTNNLRKLTLFGVLLSLFACTAVKTEHHITLDHNITIKIEKEVNDFLDDLYDEGNSSNDK